MEANCAQCHTEENFAGTPHVNAGASSSSRRTATAATRSRACREGTLGPDLTEVGKKFKIDYLWESIVDPRANLATSFMPKFNLANDDVKALVIFLKSRRGMNFAETALQRLPAATGGAEVVPAVLKSTRASPLPARRWCRREADRATAPAPPATNSAPSDGGIAPDLSYEGLIRDDEWLMDHFKNPRSRVPDSIMPAFRFPDDDFEAMTAYLVEPQDAAGRR